VGANTRLEFQREGGSFVDVELPRAQFTALRDRLQLAPGSKVFLKPRRVTRFSAHGQPGGNDDFVLGGGI